MKKFLKVLAILFGTLLTLLLIAAGVFWFWFTSGGTPSDAVEDEATEFAREASGPVMEVDALVRKANAAAKSQHADARLEQVRVQLVTDDAGHLTTTAHADRFEAFYLYPTADGVEARLCVTFSESGNEEFDRLRTDYNSECIAFRRAPSIQSFVAANRDADRTIVELSRSDANAVPVWFFNEPDEMNGNIRIPGTDLYL